MMKKTKNLRQNSHQKGYTLIELLVVMSIITLLSSIMLGSFHQAAIKGRDVRRTADIAQISKALNLYYQDHGKYPCKAHFSTSRDGNFLQPLVDGGYLAANPKDPNNINQVYDYFTFHKKPNDFSLASCGQYAFLAFYTEGKAICPSGGAYSYSDEHCHVLVPEPLPNPPCHNPYDVDDLAYCSNLWDNKNDY